MLIHKIYYNKVSMAYISVTVKCIRLHESFIALYPVTKVVSRKWWWNTQTDTSWVKKHWVEKENPHRDVVWVHVWVCVSVRLYHSIFNTLQRLIFLSWIIHKWCRCVTVAIVMSLLAGNLITNTQIPLQWQRSWGCYMSIQIKTISDKLSPTVIGVIGKGVGFF